MGTFSSSRLVRRCTFVHPWSFTSTVSQSEISNLRQFTNSQDRFHKTNSSYWLQNKLKFILRPQIRFRNTIFKKWVESLGNSKKRIFCHFHLLYSFWRHTTQIKFPKCDLCWPAPLTSSNIFQLVRSRLAGMDDFYITVGSAQRRHMFPPWASAILLQSALRSTARAASVITENTSRKHKKKAVCSSGLRDCSTK